MKHGKLAHIPVVSVLLMGVLQGADAYDRRTPVVEAVEKVLPAVVNISTSKDVTVQQSPLPFRFRSPFFEFPFEDLFQKTYRFEGLGSGVSVGDGYIITNNHVIDYDIGLAETIYVTTYDNSEAREAVIVGTEPREDIAILKVKGEPLDAALGWGRSDDLMIGETVIAIGNAFGQPSTVTTGIISGLNRTIEEDNGNRLLNLIQTNADINQGNSGGPLVNINGDFIGLNTAIISPSGGSVGLGFAIPVTRVKRIYDYWVHRILSLSDRLGMQVQDITPPVDLFFRKEFPALKDLKLNGVVVTEVMADGLAADQLKRMDIIRLVNEKEIRNQEDFSIRLEEHKGKYLTLAILRDGEPKNVIIEIAEQAIRTEMFLGMELQEIDNHWRSRYSLGPDVQGVIVLSVQQGGAAERAKIQAGDWIRRLAVDRSEVVLKNLDDIKRVEQVLRRGTKVGVEAYRRKSTFNNERSAWEQHVTVIEAGSTL